jgi:hypothetical protein
MDQKLSRPRRAALVAVASAGLLLAGCAASGTDGNVTPSWPTHASEDVGATAVNVPVEKNRDAPYPEEPVSVSLIGASAQGEIGERIPIEELMVVADGLGQDIRPELQVASPSEHIDAAQVDPNVQTTAFLSSGLRESAPIVTAATGAYTRLLVWYDNKYVQNVLRQGTSSWGWVHSRDKHAVTQTMIKKTTQFPRSRTVSGSNIYYVTPAIKYTCWLSFCSIDKQMDVRVVYETTRLSDNFAKGVITTYCVGVTVCPQWVRDVSG